MKRINRYSVRLVKENTGLYDVDNTKITTPLSAYNVIQTVLDINSEAVEKFGIITLNTKNMIAGIHIISIGSLNTSIVHPREVYKPAILNNAFSIVLFHNHPSGDPEPSQDDIDTTKRLVEAGNILGIKVLDHVIVGDGKYFSLKEKGMM